MLQAQLEKAALHMLKVSLLATMGVTALFLGHLASFSSSASCPMHKLYVRLNESEPT